MVVKASRYTRCLGTISVIPMKILVLILLLAIIASLGSGLFFLGKDNQGSPRVLKALTIRVALSVSLVAILVTAYFLGWIQPSTVVP